MVLKKEVLLKDPITESSGNEVDSLRDILERFLFYIGIPALTLYPLGFIALCVQMEGSLLPL